MAEAVSVEAEVEAEPVRSAMPAAADRRVVPVRPVRAGAESRRPRVDRSEGLARLAIALAMILAGGAFTLIKATADSATAEPAKPTFIRLDSERDKG